MKLTGSQIFVEVLVEQGVDTLFGYPGGAVLNLYDELYKNSDRIRHVLTAHEQGASHAADGYARATGRTGVVLATSGPGATNRDTPYQIIKDVSCFVKSFMCRILSEIIIFRCSISGIKEIFLGIEGSVLFRCQTDIGAVRLLLSCFDIVA